MSSMSIDILNQVKSGHIPINVWRFSLRGSSDEDCVPAGLIKFSACSWLFKFVVEWIHAIRKSAESRSLQNISNIIAVADEQSGAVYLFVALCSTWFFSSNKWFLQFGSIFCCKETKKKQFAFFIQKILIFSHR